MSTTDDFPAAAAANDPPAFIEDAAARRGILLTVCLALMAVIAAVTGLNVAQPYLALDLGATQGEVLWMINTYTISLAALLLPLGAVGDRWGRRPVLLLGLAVFGLANVLSALAPSTALMLVARLLSGVGAAFIMPVTLSVITSVFPPAERSRAIGVWTAVAGGGGILGMFLSALLVDHLSWRGLFVLPVLLVAVAAVLAWRRIPDARQTHAHGFDGGGSLLSVVAVLGLIVFLHEGPQQGWGTWPVLASLVAGVAAVLGFIAWERRQPAPILPVRLFARRGLSSGSVALLVWFGVQSGVFIVLFPFFQAVLGWSGLRATLGLMPMAVMMMGFSGVAPRLAARIGPRLTLAAGIALGVCGLVLMALQVSVVGGYLSVLPGMLVMGVGMGLAMAPATEAITAALPADQQGVASALNDVTREFGTALGIALLGAVFTAGYAGAIGPLLGNVPAAVAATAGRGIADALVIAHEGQPYSAAVRHAAQAAFVQGWQQAMWAGAAVMLGLLGFVLLRGPVRVAQADVVRR
ncbi:MFS transporter [Stenotrophomonas sp. 24(2023)]|uniref:MFS transporter n=1 Tax=Stenotrophomonas sp. 24(2023) TaxID=3068324 RepID=UPI0027DF5B59|nr:MFS transporter [Stenotrophomonas sp. 24(2023)]WMJ68919.1 MFS transporter [Stenotrophomonas sp. 24(2023)]